MSKFQLQNRQEIRHAIGRNLGIVIISTATSTGDTTSLIDTKGLLGGDDEHIQDEVVIYDANCSTGIVDGESSIVTDFDSATNDATVAPAFTASIVVGDEYEMWRYPWRVADINDAINQAIMEVTTRSLVSLETTSNFTLETTYSYDWLVPYAFGNDFKVVSLVEYVAAMGTVVEIDYCETVWTELVDTDVTATADDTYNVQGVYGLKLVVAGDAAANDILATNVVDVDLTQCDQVEITIRSSTALDADDIRLLLDDTALCASPTETLAIPATLAHTITTHVIDLDNPHSDSAIISVGIEMQVDKGAFTLHIDKIRGVNSGVKRYKPLPFEYWFISQGSTPRFHLTEMGLEVVGANTQIRLTGFGAPDIFSADNIDSEVDPSWLINKVVGELMMNHAKSPSLDIDDRKSIGGFKLANAQRQLSTITTSIPGGSRSVL